MEKNQTLTAKKIMGFTLLTLLLIAFPFLVWVSPAIAEYNPTLGVIYFIVVMIGAAVYICLVVDRLTSLFKKNKDKATRNSDDNK